MLKKIRELFGRGGQSAHPTNTKSRPSAVHHGPRVVHRPIPKSDLDQDAVKILQRLTRFDHSAYLVGGCVRDLLLDRQPKDFDIGTSATPRQIKRVFRNCRIIGRRFRLAHIYFQNGKIIEVATFRAHDGNELEAESADGKDLLIREDNEFGNPEEDAKRRDFTINALFYDLVNENILDHTDGLGDVRRKLIRTIGRPEIRFSEDPIRILRAIKFAARLGFEIEPETLEALKQTRGEIPKAAAPRILEEINRLAREGSARRAFELLRDYGVFDVILPELAEVYRDPRAWAMLAAMLDGIDGRRSEGSEVPLGVLFATLLLPAVEEQFGWNRDGKADPPRGLDVRAVVDEWLRPISLRLRLPRREQERCRQIMLLLVRMVPFHKGRRSARRSLRQRVNFPEALWILKVLGTERGGDFADAHGEWSAGAPAPRPAGKKPEARVRDADGAERDTRRRRRRRRRRSGAPGSDNGRPEPKDSPQDPKPSEKLPPPWDDSYFFAALPNAPDLPREEGDADRYGAANVGPTAPSPKPAADDPAAETEKEEGEAAPRKRRRSRRRRRGGGSRKSEDGSGGEGKP
jgi:poly(A) polymerase